MSRRNDFNAIGFVGDSDVGKTTLLERLIPALADRGLVVGSVKHASHGFEADRPGKDSHRLFTAGGQAVALIGDDQVATFTRRDAARPALLLEALATLPRGLDAVLVEGFSWEPIPRIVLVKPGRAPRPDHLAAGPVLRIVVVPESEPRSKPVFSDELVREIVAELEVWLRGRESAPPGPHVIDPPWRSRRAGSPAVGSRQRTAAGE